MNLDWNFHLDSYCMSYLVCNDWNSWSYLYCTVSFFLMIGTLVRVVVLITVWKLVMTVIRSVSDVIFLLVIKFCLKMDCGWRFWRVLLLNMTCESSSSSLLDFSSILELLWDYSSKIDSQFRFFFSYREYLWTESDIPSTAHTKPNSLSSFVCAWSAHGSPSIAFHNTSHNFSSVLSLSCARQDNRSIYVKSCLIASWSHFVSCWNFWNAICFSFWLKLILSVSLWYLFLKFWHIIVQYIASFFEAVGNNSNLLSSVEVNV